MKEKIITSGKRKTAVARAVLIVGTGKVTVNGKDYMTLQMFDKLSLEEPLRIAKEILGNLKFDISINVRGYLKPCPI